MESFQARVRILLLCSFFAHISWTMSKPLNYSLAKSVGDSEKKANLTWFPQTNRRRISSLRKHLGVKTAINRNHKQKDMKGTLAQNPSGPTIHKFTNSTSENFETTLESSKSETKNRKENNTREGVVSHASQAVNYSSLTKEPPMTSLHPLPQSQSKMSSSDVKSAVATGFVPISLRSTGSADAQIVLPNFFTHFVNHRDQYRLVVPNNPPATIRMTNDSFKNTSFINETHSDAGENEAGKSGMEHVSTTIGILRKIIEHMRTQPATYPSSTKAGLEEFVQIGHTRVASGRVTAVGDVDQNGIVDYVVSSPGKNRKRGSARLYLMGKNNSFFYSRDLVPGQWGFDAPPLHPGDLFGSVVHSLPVVNPVGKYSLIAIGAPGDLQREKKHEGEYLNKRAHVYVLKVSRKGNVLNNVQLPLEAFEKLTGKYVQAIRRLGGQISGDFSREHKHEYENEFEEESRFLDAVEGVRTVTFRTAKGDVRATIRVDDERGQKLLLKIDEFLAKAPVNRLGKTYLSDSVTHFSRSNNTGSNGCIYSDNECACEFTALSQNGDKCYNIIGERGKDGGGVCNTKPCKPGHRCTCEGNQLCRREKRNVTLLEKVGTNAGGQALCKARQVQRTVITPIDDGDARPLSSKVQSMSNLPTYNETHCACSLSQASEARTKKCFQYERTITNRAVVCKEKECDMNLLYECDWSGTAYCKHYQQTVQMYLNDGSKRDEPGYYYCHREDINRTIVECIL